MPDAMSSIAEQNKMMNSDLLTMHAGALEKDFRRVSLWRGLCSHLQSGQVVDAGGGSGFMSIEALKAGHAVTLVEPDQELISFAQETVEQMGLRDAFQAHCRPIEQITRDLVGQPRNILCLDVLEHIEKPEVALRQLCEVLEPDGTLIITVPALPWLYGKRDVAYGHYRRYTRQTLHDLARTCPELRIRTLRYWNSVGVAPYFFFEKVLQKPVNDELRQKEGGAAAKWVRKGLTNWLTFEHGLSFLPVGLSLIAVLRKSRS